MTSPCTRYLLSINEETVGGYCELLWRKGVGDASAEAEAWLPIGGYEGLYEVSNLGRVRSLHARFHEPRILCFGTDETGYPTVMLSKEGVRKPYTVHRLVALAFHGDKRNALHCQVAHLDGNMSNARADNLKWVSKVENESHKVKHGTRHPERYSCLTAEQVIELRSLHRTMSSAALAKRFGISINSVSAIVAGRRWGALKDGLKASPNPNPDGDKG